MDAGPVRTRAIGRNAIRDELARVAFPQFRDRGFDGVTFDVLAAGAGVSRSTFLRYFLSKEDVVLFVFDAVGDDIVSSLGALPAPEAEWDLLRRSLSPVVSFLSDADDKFSLMQLIWRTPALYSRLHEKQASWRPRMVERLAAREGFRPASPLALRTRVAAALECLTVAIEAWLEDEGRSELDDLLAETFDALRPAR
jgi:AcrR family transcriptional regulator